MKKLIAILILCLSCLAHAQPPKLPRVGVLSFTDVTDELRDTFREGLKENGYVEGKNILVEWRSAKGRRDLAKVEAEALVKLKVDVVVAVLTPAVQAVKDADPSMPIVMAPAGDPIATKFIVSFSRPGGNITGLTVLGAEFAGKRFELLRELFPGIARVGLLVNTTDPFSKSFIAELTTASKRAGVHLQLADVHKAEQVDSALAGLAKAGMGAVIVQGVLTGPTWDVAAAAVRHRLPVLSPQRQLVEAGALVYFGPSFGDMYRNAARYVDRILKGAKPADLPVEHPTRVELVINMRAAKNLGVTIPQSLMLRADKVIE